METTGIEAFARQAGADLFGVADLAAAGGVPTSPSDLFEGYARAVVLGVRLPDGAVDECVVGPTPVYAHAYRVANERLDHLGFQVAGALEREGCRAKPLPASLLLDRADLRGHVSYKALGRLAGLGWQGKSLLLVNPEHGPRFRMVTVLTDAPLDPDAPVRNRCGGCDACAEACPAGAIRNVGTETHYVDREEALDFEACARQCVEVFAPLPHIEKPVCGVCVRACPWGQKKKRRSAAKGGESRAPDR